MAWGLLSQQSHLPLAPPSGAAAPACLLCEEGAAHWPCWSPGDSHPPVQAQSPPPRLLQMMFSRRNLWLSPTPAQGSPGPRGAPECVLQPEIRSLASPIQAGGLVFRAALRPLPHLHHLLLLVLMCSRPEPEGAPGAGGQGQPMATPSFLCPLTYHRVIKLQITRHPILSFLSRSQNSAADTYLIPEHSPSSGMPLPGTPCPPGTPSLRLSAGLSVPGSAGPGKHTVPRPPLPRTVGAEGGSLWAPVCRAGLLFLFPLSTAPGLLSAAPGLLGVCPEVSGRKRPSQLGGLACTPSWQPVPHRESYPLSPAAPCLLPARAGTCGHSSRLHPTVSVCPVWYLPLQLSPPFAVISYTLFPPRGMTFPHWCSWHTILQDPVQKQPQAGLGSHSPGDPAGSKERGQVPAELSMPNSFFQAHSSPGLHVREEGPRGRSPPP